MSYTKTGEKSRNLSKGSDLEEFRRQWIDNVDQKFFQFCINSQAGSSSSSSSLGIDDGEVGRLKVEFERLQRKLANSEKESRRDEFFEFLPIQTCSSDQVLYVRNERLATSYNDIELLFVRDSDNDSLLSEGSVSLSRFHCSEEVHSQQSIQTQLNFLKKMRRFFKCW